ncbi:beta-2 adrenergic receptor-like [Tubulanus polymorphus]|uniref:beta-2 adrenergic receptor-like n=1 Tax=Tubulanus polymorphus TaxID=672921 RepID=UPI003DA32856
MITTTTSSPVPEEPIGDSPWVTFGKAIFLIPLNILIICGNILVIVAILKFKRLRQRISNYFILSLGVADLLVGIIVVPFAATYSLLGYWPFGSIFCNIHASFDVSLCTSSILNLCAISLDRYLAIRSPLLYHSRMTGCRAIAMIAVTWSAGFMFFIPINIGAYKAQGFEWLYEEPTICQLVMNTTFALVAVTLSFYIPLLVIIFTYSYIFKIAHSQAVKIADMEQTGANLNLEDSQSTRGGITKQKRRLKSERKAIKAVGLVVGIFLLCWLPFFIVYPTDALCRCVVEMVYNVVMWIALMNSAINPFIYAFNDDFRYAFLTLLCCNKKRWLTGSSDAPPSQIPSGPSTINDKPIFTVSHGNNR